MMSPKKKDFRVHDLAAGKHKQAPKKPKVQPVTVTRVNPEALKLANKLAEGRDVRVEIRLDGTIVIKNGGKRK